jgi:thiazole/oxazole-forming peptide maturase SagD family component
MPGHSSANSPLHVSPQDENRPARGMNIQVSSNDLDLRHATRSLLQRMLSPLCGLDKGISFGLIGSLEARFLSAGAELTGAHVLLNEPLPRQGIYHIGGSGVVREEALIRVLAETTERYAQVVSAISRRHSITMASYDEMLSRGEAVVGAEKLRFFSDDQYAQPDFPFKRFSRDSPLGWIRAASLLTPESISIPAQLAILGYRPRAEYDEGWLSSAVTTGTASHTAPGMALRNAVLELIQIDAAMGHWYSSAIAPRIVLDNRTAAIQALIQTRFHPRVPPPEFYWLPSPDLDVITVACLIQAAPGQIPAVAIGMGCDLGLVEAMYKSLLEAIGVVQMAKIVLLHEQLGESPSGVTAIDPARILDLDRNVAFYALPEHSSLINEKFAASCGVRASELPRDSTRSTRQELRDLFDQFRSRNIECFYLDLTTSEIRELGFTVLRAWSPDLITLCLPSAPPLCHPRFQSYGGARHNSPHPYP